ncbi:MAG: hypothetical protein ACTSVM_01775 [Candidatus Ranarchaeia archaeon]
MTQNSPIQLPWDYRLYQALSIVGLLPGILVLLLSFSLARNQASMFSMILLFIFPLALTFFNTYMVSMFKRGVIPGPAKKYINNRTPSAVTHRFVKALILYEIGFLWLSVIPLKWDNVLVFIEVPSIICYFIAASTMPGKLGKNNSQKIILPKPG